MMIGMCGRKYAVLAVAALACLPGTTFAQSSTTTFTYDALGRLVAASTVGGPVNGESTAITYDPAGNRTNHSVAGASAGLMAPVSRPAAALASAPGQ